MNQDRVDIWARDLHLSPKEKKLFALLAFHGEVTTDQVIEHFYGDQEDGGPDNALVSIRVILCNLRRKIKGRASIKRQTIYELDLHGL